MTFSVGALTELRNDIYSVPRIKQIEITIKTTHKYFFLKSPDLHLHQAQGLHLHLRVSSKNIGDVCKVFVYTIESTNS